MTADIINLRRARKEKMRGEHERAAAANRSAFGRTKAEKEKTAAEHRLADRKIDAHRRDPDDKA
jgi:hypothetical protein